MSIKYRRKQSQREKRLLMTMFLGLAIMVILCVSLFAAFFGTEYVIDKSLEDPDVLLNVAVVGDDIIVTIYEGRRVDELLTLSVEIEGVTLPHSIASKPAPDNGSGAVLFAGACAGITGTRDVAVRGTFSNGRSLLLKLYTVKFT
jgi:hypothetical protein